MIRRLAFCFLFLMFSQNLTANTKSTVKGTLYKKNGNWLLFVKDASGKIRKGSLKLIISEKIDDELLKEKAYVEAKGQIIKCQGQYVCLDVKSIHAAIPNAPQKYQIKSE